MTMENKDKTKFIKFQLWEEKDLVYYKPVDRNFKINIDYLK